MPPSAYYDYMYAPASNQMSYGNVTAAAENVQAQNNVA